MSQIAGQARFAALLLDLDGTLLDLDMGLFVPAYVRALADHLRGWVEPTSLSAQLMKATEAMVGSTVTSSTNAQVFSAAFYPAIGVREEELAAPIGAFYHDVFPALGYLARPMPFARELVAAAKAAGMLVGLATNPVFPEAAILERLRWSGVARGDIDVVACYEVMHTCKPHRSYFLEMARLLGCRPEECLMVGNDVADDMPAGQVGMATFLVGPEADRSCRDGIELSDWCGTLSDVASLLGLQGGAD